ncbi:MAG: hypothetical protein J7493_05865 [Porphyrobacter sp.]|nr:hypothetical protein [Porphyrobacter sp.]
MLLAVALWAFAEATLFFIVADVPIMAIGIRFGVRRAVGAALIAALAAAFGGLVTMAWAAAAPEQSRAAIESLPGIGPEMFEQAASAWREGGAWAMLQGSFRGEPYKLYAHAAGVGGAGMVGFFLASLLARLPRFMLVALAGGLAGPTLRRWLPGRWLWIVFGLAWAAFYVWYFSTMAAG